VVYFAVKLEHIHVVNNFETAIEQEQWAVADSDSE